MISFNPYDWYWNVADRGLYSSKRNVFVVSDDPELAAWLLSGANPTPIANEAELWDVLTLQAPGFRPPWLFDGVSFAQPAIGAYSVTQLRSYAAKVRFERETAGVVVGGVAIRTDRESQSLINGAYSMASRDPTFVTQWKMSSGAFVLLDADAIAGVATAVAAHVAASFNKEALLSAEISVGNISTLDQIDAAFASGVNQ